MALPEKKAPGHVHPPQTGRSRQSLYAASHAEGVRNVNIRMKRSNQIYVPDDPGRGPSVVSIIILLCIPAVVTNIIGVYLGFKRLKAEWTRKKYKDYRRYANVIGSRGNIDIRELAKQTGKNTADVANDLQTMIDKGFIGGGAYIDRATMTLYLDVRTVETEFVNETAQQSARAAQPSVRVYNTAAQQNVTSGIVNPTVRIYNTAAQQASSAFQAAQEAARQAGIEVESVQETPEEEVKQPKHGQAKRRTNGTENSDFEAKLQEIKKLNEEIEDEEVSRRIDRIGELTASIFRVVREKPEHAEEVRKFMNYYLPTTFKLLKSYSLMEKQSYQGENIVSARKKIEDVLDTLIHAFEQQQDRLFKTEALDVETDISVLETMMASDGLLETGGLKLQASGGKQ